VLQSPNCFGFAFFEVIGKSGDEEEGLGFSRNTKTERRRRRRREARGKVGRAG
jgi:hypothetical protein